HRGPREAGGQVAECQAPLSHRLCLHGGDLQVVLLNRRGQESAIGGGRDIVNPPVLDPLANAPAFPLEVPHAVAATTYTDRGVPAEECVPFIRAETGEVRRR